MTEPIDGSKEAMNLREEPSFPLEDSSYTLQDMSFPLQDMSFPPTKAKETQAHTLSPPNLPPSPPLHPVENPTIVSDFSAIRH